MSADIEVSLDGFQSAFASRNAPAWHGLGTVFEDDVTTQEMLDLAHLSNWDVRLEAVRFPADYRTTVTPYAVVRTNPFDQGTDVLATVGERYRVFQNEELFGFGDAITDTQGRWETAGSIKHGRQVFASIAMPTSITLDPNGRGDQIDQYVLLSTSHDGSLAIQASNTQVRVVCANTLAFALSGVKQSYKIRHTQTAEGKVQAAREALGLQIAYQDAFAAEAQALIEQEISDDKFYEIVKTLYPAPDTSKAATTRWETKVELLGDIWFGAADGPDTMSTIRGTAWGAVNALTEQIDWYRKPRGGNPESVLTGASGFDPVVNAQKQRVLQAVKALV